MRARWTGPAYRSQPAGHGERAADGHGSRSIYGGGLRVSASAGSKRTLCERAMDTGFRFYPRALQWPAISSLEQSGHLRSHGHTTGDWCYPGPGYRNLAKPNQRLTSDRQS